MKGELNIFPHVQNRNQIEGLEDEAKLGATEIGEGGVQL